MVAGVKITAGAASPFRVAVNGVDAASADFDQLIFDANQQPFRVWANGYFLANLIPYGTAGLAIPTVGPTTYACPVGQFPLFNVMCRTGDGGPSDFLRTAQALGGMINESDRKFYALSFAKQAGPSTPSTFYCNYLIFKNYG